MRILTAVIIVILGFNIYSLCVSSVPDVVKNAFSRRFPDRNDVDWSKRDSSLYEADFDVHGLDTQAYFASNGKWLETESEISLSQLPKRVIETITKDFPGCAIIQAEKIENERNEIFYQTDIMSAEIKKELELKDDGSMYKQQ